jgi:hypothetical protein
VTSSFGLHFQGEWKYLLKIDVLLPLDFLDADICVDCIKVKYVKTIKKGAIRATGVSNLFIRTYADP